jgi:hypothetical protein
MHWKLDNQRKGDTNCYIVNSMNYYTNIDPMQISSPKQVIILVLVFKLPLFSCLLQSKNSYAMLLKRLFFYAIWCSLWLFSWAMCFTLICAPWLCKWERIGDKNLMFIKKVKRFLHIIGWAQIAKVMLHLFLSSYSFFIIPLTKLWCELSIILHWIIMLNPKPLKACHVSRGSQLHNFGTWD